MNPRPALGFTLIEMTIVIGIILLLAGLTLSLTVAVQAGSEARQTRATIQLLDAAVREWEAQSGRKITYGQSNLPYERYEIETGQTPAQTTEDLLDILRRNSTVNQMLANIGSDFVGMVKDPDAPSMEVWAIRDAWGKPILAIIPGRDWRPADENDGILQDKDGTIRTDEENVCGVAANRQICFVSLGPDGQIGDLGAAEDSEAFAYTQDNVYSYAPLPVN